VEVLSLAGVGMILTSDVVLPLVLQALALIRTSILLLRALWLR
jgi:hypothetical protein